MHASHMHAPMRATRPTACGTSIPRPFSNMQAAQELAALGRDGEADAVLALAAPWAAVFEEVALEAGTPRDRRAAYCAAAFDAHMARLLVTWRLGRGEVGVAGGRAVSLFVCFSLSTFCLRQHLALTTTTSHPQHFSPGRRRGTRRALSRRRRGHRRADAPAARGGAAPAARGAAAGARGRGRPRRIRGGRFTA